MAPASAPLPPNPCLVAILLVVKTKTGPRIVYHYPPLPVFSSTSSARKPTWHGTSGANSDYSSESDSDVSTDSDTGGVGEDGSSKAASRSSGGRGSSRRDANTSIRSGLRSRTGPVGLNEDYDEDMPSRKQEFRDRQHQQDDRRRSSGIDRNYSDEPEWERIMGFSIEGLSKILSPARAFNKRRFELGIDNLVFLGAPRFVREDGLWKKKRRVKRKDMSDDHMNDSILTAKNDNDSATDINQRRDGSFSSISGNSVDSGDQDLRNISGFEAGYGHGSEEASEVGSETKSTSTNGPPVDNDLTMFNVVFVLNPPALEYQTRIDEMYDNVVKKFAKALKYAQAYSNFVYTESRLITIAKDKGKEQLTPMPLLWSSIGKNSSLARAIMVTYNTISQDKIAHVNIGKDIDTSLQIPQAVSVSSVPTPSEPQMPGLWLTTATPWDPDDDNMLSPHAALLLLEDDELLLKEVESDDKELSGPISYFVRNLTPEKSLLKVSRLSSLSLKDVQLLARHLIYWRRGRAIPPLRERDTYTVSPNADMGALQTAIPEFATRFPTLLSLPTILNLLSTGNPRPWYTFFPSRDHRTIFMRMLAWLLGHGWVTQLRQFGWVRVPPETKAAVAIKIETERRFPRAADRSIGNSPFTAPFDRNGELMDIDRASSVSPFRRDMSLDSISPTIPTTQPGPPSDAGSVSSGRTTVTIVTPFSPTSRPNTSHLHRPTPLSIRQSPLQEVIVNGDKEPTSPTLTAQFRSESPFDDHVSDGASTVGHHSTGSIGGTYTASIIHSPQKASRNELRWIEHIGASFGDEESKELWPVMLKYFDGKHAFEEIYVREGLKKKRVAAFLAKLYSEGWLVTVRHW